VTSAQANLNAVREKARAAAADAEYARERETRMKNLANDGFIAKDDLDQAVSEAKKAEAVRLSADAAVSAAQADLERARTALGYSAADATASNGKTVAVRAPVSGKVLKLHRESESVVNAGDPILDIGDPRTSRSGSRCSRRMRSGSGKVPPCCSSAGEATSADRKGADR